MGLFKKDITSLIISFILSYFIIVSISGFLLAVVGIKGFAVAPYIRFIGLLFTIIYFLRYLLNIKNFLSTPIYLHQESGVAFIWLVFSVFALLVGVAMSNPTFYIITDFVYILLGFCLFCVADRLSASQVNDVVFSRDKQIKFIEMVVLIIFSISLFYMINGSKMPHQMTIFIISLGLILMLLKKIWYLILLYFPVFVQIPMSNRTLLIEIMLCFMIYFISKSKIKNLMVKYLYLIFIGLAGLGLLYLSLQIMLAYVPADTPLGFRVQQTLTVLSGGFDKGQDNMVSIGQRVVEAEIVVGIWLESFANFFFSTGLGSIIDGDLLIDSSVTGAALLGSKTVHNIHLLPFALIHKYGVFGLVIFVMLFFSFLASMNNLFKIDSNNFSFIFVLSNVVFCVALVEAFPASGHLWSNPIFWLSFALKSRSTLRKRAIVT